MIPNARLIKFDISHISMMEIDGNNLDEVFSADNGVDNLEIAAENGDSFTLMYQGRILCCGGISELWKGTGQAWVIPSVYVKENPAVFARTVRRMLDSMMETHGFHRVQAIISTKLEPGVRWIEMLGFTKEGVLRKYSPQGTDYFIYGRVKA